MKKIVKISSLALVALLASCGKNSATPLKKIDGDTARSVASSILDNRLIELDKLVLKEKGVENNRLFIDSSQGPAALFPYSKRKMSADITITNKYLDPDDFMSTSPVEIIIKKHTFFDMDQLYYHCHTSMTRTSDYETVSYPDVDAYYFFIEDEKQDEDVVETKYDKFGSYYSLANYSNLAKVMINQDNGKKADFTAYLANQELFTNDLPIVTKSMPGFNFFAFNESAALSASLISVVPHLAILDNYGASFEDDVSSATTPLLMDEWLHDDFNNVINDFVDFRDAMKEVDNDKTYFNFALRSNDAKSLGVDTDFSYCEDAETPDNGDKLKGITTFNTSFAIRDLYLTESHFNITSDMELESQSFGNTSRCYFSTTLDQSINYNPSDKVEIPSDYLEYGEW